LETESIATARAISFKRESSSSILILDFGANGTDMSVVKTGNLIFAQSLGTGSDALTKAIQNDYGITEQQAEQYKRSYGLLADQGEGKILKSLSPVMDIIVNEINKTVNYFKANIQEGTPQLIYVVGDGAKLPGLAEFLSQKLGIQSQIADPTEFLGITNSIKGEVEQMNAVGFTVALGLAMKTE
jgi:type IV pilus assembly protein PilM